ncbi:Skp1 family, dimerization domain-domain-containing protein [Catenaria anguillulae PL171]|uniref:E3 ubiquitin ligase complex SCF subunit n=1 Tax=Catenaria anguillulae PL171 TaxID=765915 RepID=A0A1Y2HDM1_9FUNG|nr:Skp1 family, dimerization domain-domain-containing protein [Catenaria anguillulae PL171]
MTNAQSIIDPNLPIKLMTSDHVEVSLPHKLAVRSNLLKNMLSDMDDLDALGPIPLPNIDEAMFKKILSFLEHHKDEEYPEPDPNADEYEELEKLRQSAVDPWDREYYGTDVTYMSRIVVAANYLDIKPLLDLGCKLLAQEIDKCKDDEEIRAKFGFPDDLSQAEKEQIRKEFAWADLKPPTKPEEGNSE